jgi:uncharacterized DUF497 family protein
LSTIHTVSGFDWDAGNREKCCKHGLTIAEIEEVFSRSPAIFPDLLNSNAEARLRGIGQIASGRWVFLVFTVRHHQGRSLIRPISARFMHLKEISFYESLISEAQTAPGVADR